MIALDNAQLEMLITLSKEIIMTSMLRIELNKNLVNFSLFYEITKWEMLTLKLGK